MSTIVIIDDSDKTCDYLSTVLSEYNHKVITAKNLRDGLAVVKKSKPDLIITDILMSNIDGYDFVLAMKRDPILKDIPVIFYTSTYRTDIAAFLSKDIDVKYVLSKPSKPHVIINTIHNVLGLKSIPNDLEKLTSTSTKLKATSQNHKNIIQYDSISKKLAPLFDLHLNLISEKDEKKLLTLFCDGVNTIIDAECAVAGIFDNNGKVIEYVHSGECEDKFNELDQNISTKDSFITKFQTSPLAFIDNSVDSNHNIPLYLNIPKSLLGAPFLTSTHLFGFVYFLNKKSANGFTNEDLNVVETLIAELGIIYENNQLHILVQKHSANLQVENRKRKVVEDELRKNELMFHQFAENIDEVFFVTTPDLNQVIYISPGYEKIWGKSCESLYQNPHSWLDSIIEEDKSTAQNGLQEIVENGKSGTLKYRIIRSDETLRHINVKLSCLKDKEGNIHNLIGIASDISEYVLEQKGIEIIKHIKYILDNSPSFREAAPQLTKYLRTAFAWKFAELWLIDYSKNVLRNISNSYETNLYAAFASTGSNLTLALNEGLPGKIWQAKAPLWVSDFSENLTYPRADDAKKCELHQAVGFPFIYQNEIFGVLNFISTHIHKPDINLINLLTSIGSQIGEFIAHKYTEEQLDVLSRKDILTGLINRATIEEELANDLSKNPNQILAVAIIGIDRMRLINQSYGFDAGEIFLKNVTHRLLENMSESTTIFRAGGPNFGFVISKIEDKSAVDDFATKLFNLFEAPFEIEGQKLIATINIGVSLYPQDAKLCKDLLKFAGIAHRFAQEEGGNQMRYFSSEIASISSKKLILENDMRKGLENNEFTLYYQPKVHMKSKLVTGVEALLRWNHPKNGLMVAADFIPLAEETGFIIQLGDWVMKEACHTLHDLCSTNPSFSMSVNLSIRQFRAQDFIKKLQILIDECDILPDSLELEITENFIMSNLTQFSEAINIIKDTLGVRVSLDDFGTGYSSLSYLTYAQIDCIKIDKSFIDGIPDSTNNTAIIKAIIAIAKALAIKSVAEGVESQEQWDFLSKAGCDEVQGYFCARPMPKDQLIDFLQDELNLYSSKNK